MDLDEEELTSELAKTKQDSKSTDEVREFEKRLNEQANIHLNQSNKPQLNISEEWIKKI